MHDNLFNKNLLHTISMAWVLTALLGSGLAQWLSEKWQLPWEAKTGRLRDEADKPRGQVFHATRGGQLYRPGEPAESPSEPGEDMDGHDIISAVQRAHEAMVALWLARSWRCNLGGAPRTEATWLERHAFLLVDQATRNGPDSEAPNPPDSEKKLNAASARPWLWLGPFKQMNTLVWVQKYPRRNE